MLFESIKKEWGSYDHGKVRGAYLFPLEIRNHFIKTNCLNALLEEKATDITKSNVTATSMQ